MKPSYEIEQWEGSTAEHCPSAKYNSVVSLHTFPSHNQLRKIWTVIIGYENFIIAQHSHVWSRDIAAQDLREPHEEGGRRTLKPSAVPILFYWNNYSLGLCIRLLNLPHGSEAACAHCEFSPEGGVSKYSYRKNKKKHKRTINLTQRWLHIHFYVQCELNFHHWILRYLYQCPNQNNILIYPSNCLLIMVPPIHSHQLNTYPNY